MKAPYILAVLLLAGSAALAHQGVKNSAVKARMDSMVVQNKAVETLGQMAKGTTAFDVDQARAALLELRKAAAETPDLFAAPEQDPKSEALPLIWEEFDAFTAHAATLEAEAAALSQTLVSKDDLPGALRSIGQACSACHRDYRASR
ncbi:MAG: cytochrome c [Pseudomonadota bacterium]